MIGIVVILFLIAVNGVFVAMEFVIVGARLSRLQTVSNRGRGIASQLAGSAAQDRYVAVAQLGVTLASIGLGMYGEHKIAGWLEAPLGLIGVEGALLHLIALILALVVLTYFHVVLGEMIPKAMALKGAEALLVAMWPLIRLFEVVFRPLVWLLNVISRLLLSLFGLDHTAARHHTPRELADIAETSSEGGAISAEQAEFIQNIVRFQRRRADELMTPRREVRAIDLSAAGEGPIAEEILAAGPSRLPVVRGGLDAAAGVVHVKDVIRHSAQSEAPLDARALEGLLRPLPRVPAQIDARALLDGMRVRGAHMALVVDEFGAVIGTVALEDAIEEIVGEGHSEFDPDALEAERREGRPCRVRGTLALSRLRERFGWQLESRRARTIAGYLVERLGRPPREGDVCETKALRLRVSAVDGLAITEVSVEEIGKEAQAGDTTPGQARPVAGREANDPPEAAAEREAVAESRERRSAS